MLLVHLGLLAPLGAGCDGLSSRIHPDLPLAELPPGEEQRLCRFTTDVLADTEPSCVRFTREFDACVASPPWRACAADGREADVGSWEACVRASRDCAADAEVCWHVACL
ncbi:MAG: hypothetical protein KF729_36840 [Sandaracinaceae bacterium]|nr:hypothetical protein [Sandaracinaceae bacterium]